MPHFQFYDSTSRPDWHSKRFFCQGLASQVREKPPRAQGPVMGWVGYSHHSSFNPPGSLVGLDFPKATEH